MNFLVTVACVVGIGNCPLPDKKPIVKTIQASSLHDCKVRVIDLITYYSYEPHNFTIKCESK